MADSEHTLAVFIDFENLALGLERDRSGRPKKRSESFDMAKVMDRLVEKGKVLVKIAYADWGRFDEYRERMHDAGIQMREIPERGKMGKNHADIQLCVDAMDMCYSKEHIDTFVVVSGDSDFTPLVSKLKENGKSVIGLGMKDSTSELLASSCDEFIYYEDIVKSAAVAPSIDWKKVPSGKVKAMRLLSETLEGLQREGKDVMYSSLVKDTMKRKRPSFSESSYGYRSFSAMLEDAQKLGLIGLKIDQRSGTYVVTEVAHGS
jgi:uncharacterized protein (TIGR00288 family)